MNIRRLTLDDLEQLTALFDAYRVWYRKPSDPERASSFLHDRLKAGESHVFGAFDHDEMVGFTQLYPLFSSTRMGKLWLLNDLYVLPDYRGGGIGKLLLGAAKELARQTNSVGVMLETEKDNMIGNHLYPQAGFHLETDFNHYFWSTER